MVVSIVLLLATAQAVSAPPAILAKGTRQLSATELNAKLVDAEVELIVPPELRWLHPGEYFFRDGKYILYEHQEKSTGSFRIHGDAVCTTVEGESEKCRFIFVDVDGLFWIGPNKTYVDQFRQIRFKRIENR